jgi:HTH-type transcriptional regulator / antitoxin HigA
MKYSVEIFPPGEFLIDELDARNWTQTEFAEIIGRPYRLVNEVILGKRAITPETAIQFAEGLGTSPELWMNLESQYQLSKVHPQENVIKRKAALREIYPVREMINRGWIEKSENVEILEQQCLNHFEIEELNEPPMIQHAAKKTSYKDISIQQLAWIFRAKKIASSQIVSKFNRKDLIGSLEELRNLMSAPEETRHVTKILNNCGVRFVIVEAFSGSRIDGACFWLSGKEPVIVMSTKEDRIDNFWFVLRHEIEHIIQGDGKDGTPIIDEDVGNRSEDSLPEIELVANRAASEFCVNGAELDGYIARVNPYYFSTKRVIGFARRIGVHPGVVVGQLHNRFKEYKYLRGYLVKIRHIVTESAPTDGWGNIYPIEE